MANDCFLFRQFLVRQDLCAMKVGTDGTLLGAWAGGGQRVLDVGTGTGLIALMMAQRFPGARVVAIDIAASAVEQARGNVAASPFATRIDVELADVAGFDTPQPFDAVVCNPPYFVDSLTCPDDERTLARHAATLTYRQLMESARRLLADGGELSVIIPSDSLALIEGEAALAGLFKTRQCAVRTVPHKPPRRHLLAFRKHPAALEPAEGVIVGTDGCRTAWYQQLTRDFYIK